jgi:hypothetical protein
MARRLVPCSIVLAFALAAPAVALADPYILSGNARRVGFGTSLFEISGILNLADPILENEGPEAPDGSDRYRVWYAMTYTFYVGTDVLSGAGYMVIDAQGCGLFDCNFAAPITDAAGNRGLWESGTGAFFRDDRTAYRDPELHSLDYAVAPGIIEFYGTSLQPRGFSDRYFMDEPLVATRAAGVPEPSTLLLVGAGAVALLRRGRRASRSSPP